MSIRLQRPPAVSGGNPMEQIGRLQRYLSLLVDETNLAIEMLETAISQAKASADNAAGNKTPVYSPRETFSENKPLLAGFADCLIPWEALAATEAEPLDLDTMKTMGNYYSADGEISRYIQNCPITDRGFRLQVRQMQTENHLRQELTSGSDILLRHLAEDSWSDWVAVTTQAVS